MIDFTDYDQPYKKRYVSLQIALIDRWTIKKHEAHKIDIHGCHLMGVISYQNDGEVEISYQKFTPNPEQIYGAILPAKAPSNSVLNHTLKIDTAVRLVDIAEVAKPNKQTSVEVD